MCEEKLVEVKAEDANNYCRILTLLEMEEEGDPVAMVERLVRIADGLFDALKPLGSNYRRCPSTLLTSVVNIKRQGQEDRVLADRYRFLREPKASAPETLPGEKWIVVGCAGHEDILSHEALDKAIDEAMKAKGYEYDPEGGPPAVLPGWRAGLGRCPESRASTRGVGRIQRRLASSGYR